MNDRRCVPPTNAKQLDAVTRQLIQRMESDARGANNPPDFDRAETHGLAQSPLNPNFYVFIE